MKQLTSGNAICFTQLHILKEFSAVFSRAFWSARYQNLIEIFSFLNQGFLQLAKTETKLLPLS